MQHPHAETVSHTPRARIAPVQPLATDALDYHLPAERVATHPAQPRDAARMLVISRGDQAFIEHRCVRDLPAYLHPGDALVFNNTAVAPARLEMRRRGGEGGRVEGLFLTEDSAHPVRWTIMLRSGGRISVGETLALIDRGDRVTDLSLRILQHDGDQWRVEVEGSRTTREALDRVGRTPLPPYILKARHEHHESYGDDDDQRWYQTVYADAERRQSVAAPTAGLHFTPELLRTIESHGVRRVNLTLHVGPGTFKPVTASTLSEHRMHSEWFEVQAEAVTAMRDVRAAGGRVIAVGTTTARTLESLPLGALAHAESCGGFRGSTDLLIAPGHDFRHLDGLLTNFHLPRSTLLALVAALLGLDRLLALYREAIERGYRFYSYGDAMLILP